MNGVGRREQRRAGLERGVTRCSIRAHRNAQPGCITVDESHGKAEIERDGKQPVCDSHVGNLLWSAKHHLDAGFRVKSELEIEKPRGLDAVVSKTALVSEICANE